MKNKVLGYAIDVLSVLVVMTILAIALHYVVQFYQETETSQTCLTAGQ
ncbi:hypothetical protein MA9V1_054 [Chryseobacterium phage MA9V-1]|nr:hypothetical protein MA9V1_054 [Chryseobacterium phage MA9V-1]